MAPNTVSRPQDISTQDAASLGLAAYIKSVTICGKESTHHAMPTENESQEMYTQKHGKPVRRN